MNWTLEDSPIGRIVVPPSLPAGVAMFCTSAGFEGRLNDHTTAAILDVLSARFGIDARLATCQQVHGAEVVSIEGNGTARWCENANCDALISFDRAVALGIKIADCLPVSIIDTRNRVVANVHSGWRGAAARIVPRTLERLDLAGHFDRPSAVAFLGPSIRDCCFEVGEEVVVHLSKAYGDVGEFVDRGRGPKPHIDLAGLTASVLERQGFRRDSIHDSGICTRCDGSIFHSFRRDGERAGRNIAIVALG